MAIPGLKFLPNKDMMELITKVVCTYLKIPRNDLLIKRRFRYLVHARHVIMYLARQKTSYTLKEIGNTLGGYDHTSVLNAVKSINNLLFSDPAIRIEVEKISEEL